MCCTGGSSDGGGILSCLLCFIIIALSGLLVYYIKLKGEPVINFKSTSTGDCSADSSSSDSLIQIASLTSIVQTSHAFRQSQYAMRFFLQEQFSWFGQADANPVCLRSAIKTSTGSGELCSEPTKLTFSADINRCLCLCERFGCSTYAHNGVQCKLWTGSCTIEAPAISGENAVGQASWQSFSVVQGAVDDINLTVEKVATTTTTTTTVAPIEPVTEPPVVAPPAAPVVAPPAAPVVDPAAEAPPPDGSAEPAPPAVEAQPPAAEAPPPAAEVQPPAAEASSPAAEAPPPAAAAPPAAEAPPPAAEAQPPAAAAEVQPPAEVPPPAAEAPAPPAAEEEAPPPPAEEEAPPPPAEEEAPPPPAEEEAPPPPGGEEEAPPPPPAEEEAPAPPAAEEEAPPPPAEEEEEAPPPPPAEVEVAFGIHRRLLQDTDVVQTDEVQAILMSYFDRYSTDKELFPAGAPPTGIPVASASIMISDACLNLRLQVPQPGEQMIAAQGALDLNKDGFVTSDELYGVLGPTLRQLLALPAATPPAPAGKN